MTSNMADAITDAMIVKLMNELHSHVPEADRPMSMSDLSNEQAERARRAISGILSMAGEAPALPRLTMQDEETIDEWFTGAGSKGASIPPSQRAATPYCPNCGESCLDKWHSSQSVAGDDVERMKYAIQVAFNERLPGLIVDEDADFIARAALTALQVTEGDKVEQRLRSALTQATGRLVQLGEDVSFVRTALHSKQEGD